MKEKQTTNEILSPAETDLPLPSAGASDATPSPSGTDTESLPAAPYKVFATKDDWQTEINRIISNRLKDHSELKSLCAAQQASIETLMAQVADLQKIEDGAADKWQADMERIHAQYPAYDLEAVLANEKFIDLLTKGVSCEDAFKVVGYDELIADAEAAGKNAVLSGIRAKGERPLEVGLSPRNGMTVRSDPRHLTDKDIKAIGERVMRGERVIL